MQINNEVNSVFSIPEHYLFWTLQNRSLLKDVLRTLDGRVLVIGNAGMLNPDNGPDFLNASISVGGTYMRGDMECHVKWQDWYGHGHDNDRRYSQVILHILWEVPENIPEKLAGKFPHLVLSQFLSLEREEWLRMMKSLEKDLVSPVPELQVTTLSESKIRQLAEERFRRKGAEIRNWSEAYGWENALYIGVGRSLGYSKNSAPFVELLKNFPASEIVQSVHPLQRSPLIFWSVLAWQSGLLERPLRREHDSGEDFWYRFLYQVKKQLQHRLPVRRQSLLQWNFSRLRPYNSPYFRMAGLAQLLFHYQERSLFQHLLNLFTERYELNRLMSEIELLLCIPLSTEFQPLFSRLLGFGVAPQRSMGKQRCDLFILNILLPLFHVWAGMHHHSGFQWYIEDMYFQFPPVDSHRALTSGQMPEFSKAYQQQAILEYYSLARGGESKNGLTCS